MSRYIDADKIQYKNGIVTRLAIEEMPMAEVKPAEAIEMAIEALEQKPCEDAISRQAALDLVADYDLSMGQVVKGIHALPPVTAQPKMGRWIEHFDESGKWYECDQCHTDWGGYVNYCPNCGAKMKKESEEEE